MRGQVANFVFRPVGVQMQNRNLPCPEAALGGSHLQGPPPCSEVTEGTEEALFQCSWLTEEASSHQCHEQCPVDREAKPTVHAVHGAYLHHPAREPPQTNGEGEQLSSSIVARNSRVVTSAPVESKSQKG